MGRSKPTPRAECASLAAARVVVSSLPIVSVSLCACACVALASACSPGPSATASRPSIVLMVADDLGPEYLGAYGDGLGASPRIDRLAAEGMRFEAVFTPTALCRPSRWSLYTGLYPPASGVHGFNRVPRDKSLLHEVLRAEGYFTGLLAKFGSKVQDFSPFDFFVGNPELDGGIDLDAVGREVDRFLDEAGQRPFFLIVGFGDPHTPYPEAPFCDAERVDVPGYLPDLPAVRETLARYYAGVERLDRGVGLVLDALEARGLARNTVVLLTSDHGPAFPFAKSTLYDAGVRVPLVVRWPGRVEPGTVAEEPISFVDVRPTLLDAAAVTDPARVHGRSFLARLEGRPYRARDAVWLSHTSNFEGSYPMRAVRTPEFKYIRNFEPESVFDARLEHQSMWSAMTAAAEGDPELKRRLRAYAARPAEELYRLDTDPWERRNLIADPELRPRVAELRSLLEATLQEVDDPLVAVTGGP